MTGDTKGKRPPTKGAAGADRAKIRDLQLPEFIGMPSGKEAEFYSGLRRGALNQLVLPCTANNFRPPVKSITLRRPGTVKGNRLIVLASLLEYLRNLQREQDSQAA